jgi:hypothetical protein
VVAIAACALLVTLHLRDVMSDPFDDLMRATNGAHQASSVVPRKEAGPPTEASTWEGEEGRKQIWGGRAQSIHRHAPAHL